MFFVTGRDTTRHVTVIPIDRSIRNIDRQQTGVLPTGFNIYNHESNVGERAYQFSGGSDGESIQQFSGNRLQVPTFVIGQESDTESDSRMTFKESKFSKMGGNQVT